MSLALAAVAALSASTTLPPSLPACSWNRPGHNPFTGDVVAAVDRYADIPAPVRQRLKARMASRSYDEIVSIRRDSIVGQARYRPEIRDMHFGSGQVCGTVDRVQWAPQAQERGLVYCEAGHCILVPTVCRNVSRIRRDEPERAASSAAGDARGAGRPGDAGAPAPGSPAGLADAPPDSAGGMPVAGAAPLLSSDADSAAAPLTFVDGLRGGTSPTQAG